jgi:hypothetical protein
MIPAAPVEGAPAASLAISGAELAALLQLARAVVGAPATEQSLAGLTAAGWVVDGAPAGVLAEGLAALTAPVCELDLQRGARRGHGCVGERFATLVGPAPEGAGYRLIVVTTAFLPDVLSRLNDVSPRPRLAPALLLRYSQGDLARILAGRDAALAASLAGDDDTALVAAKLVEGLREHWRVEARWAQAGGGQGRRAVEVLDTDHGLWRVVPDGAAVELRASTPTAVFRALVGLLPSDAELTSVEESP